MARPEWWDQAGPVRYRFLNNNLAPLSATGTLEMLCTRCGAKVMFTANQRSHQLHHMFLAAHQHERMQLKLPFMRKDPVV